MLRDESNEFIRIHLPKRQGFIGIQQGHTVPTDGYEPPMVRTGYESVIGMRTGDMFARVAVMDGVVTSVTETGITVKYKDGSEKGYPLGMLYGKAEGSVYPNTLKTEMRVGQKFKKDEYLTYNTKFFQHDPILPGGMVYKGSLMTRVALMEVPHTFEDSSAISEKLSRRLMTATLKPKMYTVNFKENVHDVVKVGQRLKPEDIMLIIEDEITAMDGSLSAGSLDILSERSKNAPKSGYVGTVVGVDVRYHGLKSDMSASLKALADKSDRIRAEQAKSRNEQASTGYVDSDFSVNGTPLAVNKAVITIHINVDDDASTGDKVTYGAQLKSVIGEVMPYKLRTASGDEVDAKMGARSFAARIVSSLIEMGARGMALEGIGRTAMKAYRGE